MFWKNRLVTVVSFSMERNRAASLLILTLKLCSVSKRVDLANGGFGYHVCKNTKPNQICGDKIS
jgi:hypothetical protein